MAVLVDSIELVPVKFCGGCGTEKPETAFNKNRSMKDGLQCRCRACGKGQKRGNQERLRLKILRGRRRRDLITRAGGVCVDCNGVFPSCAFDFHHRDPSQKLFPLSQGHLERRWEALTLEADKCLLLCANCHRIRHHG